MKHLTKLLLMMLALMLPATASAYDFEVDGIYYEILGDNQVAVTFQGYDDELDEPIHSYSGNVTIPETVTYEGTTYSVTSIGPGAFCDCIGLTSVTIPNSVTTIDSGFCGCSGLTSVTIGNSVTSIGYGTFHGCSGLTSVTIGSSVYYIDNGAFQGCSALDTINFNAVNCYDFEMTEIGDSPFEGLNISTIIIGDGVQRIPANFALFCSRLTSVTIPNSVTYIGEHAFGGTAWYDHQPDGLIYAGLVAYKYKGIMPAGTSIILADGTLGIAGSAFAGCSGLTSVTIGSSVSYIGVNAFSGCTALDTLNFNAVNCYDFEMTEIGDSPFEGLNISTIIIGDGVQRIPANFALHCSRLTSVTIPNSVTSIGGWAFCGCSGLTSVTIPNSVTYIGEYAFGGCSGLTSVTIPNSVTSIGSYAFSGCSGLTSVTIPNSVTRIGWNAFQYCSGLNDVFTFIDDPTTVSMGGSVFYQYQNNYAERTLHVPFGTSAAYQANTGWSQYFGSIVEMGPMVATSIELDKSTVRMENGEKLQLTAELQPIEAIYNEVLWGSSNPAVAMVSNNGLVTAVNVGTATITAMTTDGSNLSASCIVTVYTEMMGDVDGNGSVNISDVTALIDYLLKGDASDIVLSNADCDGNEAVNISDVTTLIDYLLSGSWPEPEEPEPTPVITSYTVNGVTFNLVEVEGGTFSMGATPEQGENANDNEKPVHQVTLSGFNIGQTEVTQELWQAVMGTNPSKFNDNVNKPVETISWEDCQTFIATLNNLTGQNFRLPTEAEWEFAARGGMKSLGYKYSGSDDLNEIAWYNYNAYAVGSSSPDYGTHAAATKAPNELGLYDMTGNVWEWCQDWSGDYSAADQINPTGPETGTNRVIRGGGWTNYPSLLRVAARTGYKPGFIGNFIGFRLAL